MTLLGILLPLVSAICIILVAPLLLSTGTWRIAHPHLALRAWLIAIFVGGAGLVVSLVAAVVEIMFSASQRSGEWIGPVAVTLFGWVGLAAVGGLVALAFARYEPISAAERRVGIQVLMLAASSTYRRECLRGVDVSYIDSDSIAAISTRGSGRQIIVSRRLDETLTSAQLRSVLEHERAHLIEGHDRIVRLAQLNLACFPVLLGARSFETNVHLLIELAADDHAARRSGHEATADALEVMTELTGEESMALRALRLRRQAERAAAHHRAVGQTLPGRASA